MLTKHQRQAHGDKQSPVIFYGKGPKSAHPDSAVNLKPTSFAFHKP